MPKGIYKRKKKPLIERFESKFISVSKDQCWNWFSHKNNRGYGVFSLNNKNILAHRMSYILYIGKIPKDLNVLHKCDNRKCVNPSHLFSGTQQDNMDDMSNKGHRISIGLRGGNSSSAKLTNNDVKCIRKMLNKGILQKIIANKFGVCERTIGRIKLGQTWVSNA